MQQKLMKCSMFKNNALVTFLGESKLDDTTNLSTESD